MKNLPKTLQLIVDFLHDPFAAILNDRVRVSSSYYLFFLFEKTKKRRIYLDGCCTEV